MTRRRRPNGLTPREAFAWYMPGEPPVGDVCWDWAGGTVSEKRGGYGRIMIEGRSVLAHRLSHQLFVGPVSPDLVVRHECDRPICVQPRHLTIGTDADNVADMVRRGRQARGEKHSQSRLTWVEVARIREAYERGESQHAIARAYGVCQMTISKIVRHKTWVG